MGCSRNIYLCYFWDIQYKIFSSGETVELVVKAVKRKPLKDCEHLFNVLFMRMQDVLKVLITIKE